MQQQHDRESTAGKKRKAILIAVGVLCALLSFGVWGVLYNRNEQKNLEQANMIRAFNDSIENVAMLEAWRRDSINDALEAEERRCMITPSDFLRAAPPAPVVPEFAEQDLYETAGNVPVYDPNGRERLLEKKFRVVHTKAAREKSDNGYFYPASYIVFERLFRNHGYMWVTFYDGLYSQVTITFPDKELADLFMNRLYQEGFSGGGGPTSISWPSDTRVKITTRL